MNWRKEQTVLQIITFLAYAIPCCSIFLKRFKSKSIIIDRFFDIKFNLLFIVFSRPLHYQSKINLISTLSNASLQSTSRPPFSSSNLTTYSFFFYLPPSSFPSFTDSCLAFCTCFDICLITPFIFVGMRYFLSLAL